MNLRESLRPYVAALSHEAAATNTPLMRAMMLQWPDDAGSQGTDVEDQVSQQPAACASPPQPPLHAPSLADHVRGPCSSCLAHRGS